MYLLVTEPFEWPTSAAIVFLDLGGCPQDLTQGAIFGLRETAVAHVVLRLIQTVGWVAVDDAGLDGVGEDAAQQADRPGRRTRAAADDGLSTQLFRLDGDPRIPGHDVLQHLVYVGLGEVLHPSRADQRNDVPVDAAGIADDGRRLFGAAALAEDEARIEIGQVEGAKLLNGDRLVVDLSLLSGIVAARDPPELNLRLLSGGLRSPRGGRNLVAHRPR